MVKKLYKYEFKSYGLWVLLMYAAMLVAAVLLVVSLHLTEGISTTGDNYELAKAFKNSVRLLFSVIYAVSIIASFTMIVILPLVRFYKNMLTPEGYLTLSLPIKPSQHIICKTAVAYLYQAGAVVALMLSLFLIALLSGDFSEIMIIAGNVFEELWNVFTDPDLSVRPQIIIVLISALLAPIASILTYYFCLASGMLFGKYKLVGSVLVYIIIQTAASVLTGIAQIVIMPFSMLINAPATYFLIISLFGLLCVVAQIFVFYMLTHYLFKNKVNL